MSVVVGKDLVHVTVRVSNCLSPQPCWLWVGGE